MLKQETGLDFYKPKARYFTNHPQAITLIQTGDKISSTRVSSRPYTDISVSNKGQQIWYKHVRSYIKLFGSDISFPLYKLRVRKAKHRADTIADRMNYRNPNFYPQPRISK